MSRYNSDLQSSQDTQVPRDLHDSEIEAGLSSRGMGEGDSSYGVNDDQSTVINQTREETDTGHSDSVSQTYTSSPGSTDASSSAPVPNHIQVIGSPDIDICAGDLEMGKTQDPTPRTTSSRGSTDASSSAPVPNHTQGTGSPDNVICTGDLEMGITQDPTPRTMAKRTLPSWPQPVQINPDQANPFQNKGRRILTSARRGRCA